MATIVRLTTASGGPVYVNADLVTHFSRFQDVTWVHFGANRSAVVESPSEVAQIIRQANGPTDAA